MPITTFELAAGIAILASVLTMTILLNKRRRGWGWTFLIGVIVVFVIGNFIEILVA
jgi:hypothetical protein